MQEQRPLVEKPQRSGRFLPPTDCARSVMAFCDKFPRMTRYHSRPRGGLIGRERGPRNCFWLGLRHFQRRSLKIYQTRLSDRVVGARWSKVESTRGELSLPEGPVYYLSSKQTRAGSHGDGHGAWRSHGGGHGAAGGGGAGAASPRGAASSRGGCGHGTAGARGVRAAVRVRHGPVLAGAGGAQQWPWHDGRENTKIAPTL